MALTTTRVVALTVLAAAGIAVALLPPAPTDFIDAPQYPRYSRVGALSEAAFAAERRLRMLQLRDTAVAIARRHSGDDFWLDFPGGRFVPRVRAAWDTLRAALADGAGRVGLIVRSERRTWQRQLAIYLIPERQGGSCVAAFHEWDETELTAVELSRALGPCLMHRKFGAAGTHVAAWLRTTSAQPAYDPWWTPRPDAPVANDDGGESGGPLVWRTVEAQLRGHYLSTLEASACAAREAFCDTALQIVSRYRSFGRWPALETQGVTIRQAPVRNSFWYEPTFSFLADLIRVEGEERFARFWRSAAPLDTAFAAAFGVTRARWTSRWLARQRNGSVAALRPLSVVWSLLLAIGFVGGAGWLATRRRVG